MDRDELMAMLDLKPAQTSAPSAGGRSTAPTSRAGGKYVLETDAWDRDKGEQLRKDNALTHPKVTGPNWADLHTAYFGSDPRPAEQEPADEKFKDFVDGVLGHPDTQAAREKTAHSPLGAEMAAVEAASKWAEFLARKEEDDRRCNGGGGGRKPKDPEEQTAKEERALNRAAAKAAKAGAAAADEAEDIERGLGAGGTGATDLDPKQAAELFKTIKNNPQLRRIFELAGRYRRAARARQRTKVSHGADEVTGTELAGEVARLLPAELAKLTDEDLELDLLRRVADNEAFCRQMKGTEKVGKGPVVVVVDESGSMKGGPVAAAKGFALAMAWVARHQKRWCALVGFSGGTQGTRLVLPPGRWDQEGLLQWLAHFFGAGTDCDIPLKELPFTYWPEFEKTGMQKGKTDVIFITDGVVNVDPGLEARFKGWKAKEKVRAIGIVLNSDPGSMRNVLDECYRVADLGLGQEAVGRCLGI